MEGIAIILLTLCLISILLSVCAADTIAGNQTIRDGDTIVSARGEFELGFFSPRDRPNDRYFGIWYKKISTGTVVWVANRATPVANASGVIRVSSRGIMLSTNYHNSTDMIIIWSSNYSRSVNSPKAQLLDTGNLVFMDEEGGDIVWQSFDYPTDNILPDMKFGVDLVSGMNRYFVPWKSEQDPSPGSYVYMLDISGYPQILLWKDSVIAYRVGPWLGPRTSGNPTLKPNGIYTSKFVIAKNEIYYISNLVNASDSAITRFVVTPAGVIQRLLWNKQKLEWTVFLTLQTGDCDIYGYCGTYGVCNANKYPRCECIKGFRPKVEKEWAEADWSDGCARNVPLSCGNGDGFLKFSGVKIPDTRWAWYNLTMDITECESNCLKNCNCTAYSRTDFTDGGKGCLLWFGGLIDIRGYSEDGQDLYVKLAASEITRYRDTRQEKRLWIIIAPVVVITVILGLFLFYALKKRWLNRKELLQHNQMQDLELPLFDFIQIANATNSFSSCNKLGEGGFGTVYKGMLTVGQEIAVKRLSTDSRQGLVEFMNEVLCIAKLQHRNLVKLIGCCIQEQERLLIYEYMPNGSLDSSIFDKQKSKFFDWPKRYNIINGIAKGLLYLHQDSRLRIIHRDLKASNILLDSEMNPKISDFGLARIFGGSETQTSTTRVVGTYGYMPPEYAIDGLFSVKSDVYSFGVLLLEIITGTRNRYFHCAEHNLNLIGHAWKKYNEGNMSEVVDNLILNSSNEEEIFRVIQIGLLCVQEYPEDRPNMSLTLQMLTSTNVLPAPKQPGFFSERRKHHETGFSSSNAASSRLYDYSISFFAPR